MTYSFLVQLDADDMEYHAAFDPQPIADALLTTITTKALEQKLGVMDAEVKFLGVN